MTHNDPYRDRTAPLTSKSFILYIYSTNIGTEYFKHGIYSPFFSLQNAVCFIILTYLGPVLFTFYIQGVLKLKKHNYGDKRSMFTCIFNVVNKYRNNYSKFQYEKCVGRRYNYIDRKLTAGFVRIEVTGKYHEEYKGIW